VLVALVGSARADDKLVRQYAGQIVISPDPIPTVDADVATFVKLNAAKDGRYDLLKGPPWEIHLIGFLTKDPGAPEVALVFSELADRKLVAIHSIQVAVQHRIVIATAKATTAAGFQPGKTYVLRLMRNKLVLARAELTLRD
jgi:hypothetical protein